MKFLCQPQNTHTHTHTDIPTHTHTHTHTDKDTHLCTDRQIELQLLRHYNKPGNRYVSIISLELIIHHQTMVSLEAGESDHPQC